MFEIYRFRYVAKNELCFTIFARTQETAQKIIDILNSRYKDLEPYRPKRMGFSKKIKIATPPYELEQEQMEFMKVYKRRKK